MVARAHGPARPAGWLALGLLVAAGLADLGGLHRLEHGDSILPVLVSLQRWTPFYWDQERYGMLVPLLALPVRDPLWNLLLQRFLLVAAGLAAVVLLARHVLPRRDWLLTGALAGAALLLAPSEAWSFEYLGDQPYGLSLALALAGLAVAEPAQGEPGPAEERPGRRRGPGRLAAGLLLVLLAHWVNAATGLVLGLLAAARAVEDLLAGEPPDAVRGRLLVDGGLLAAGLAAGQAAIRLYPWWSGNPLRLVEGFLPPAEWPQAWAALARATVASEGRWLAGLAVMAAAGLALLGLPAHRRARREALVRAGTLLTAALSILLLVAPLRWVAENHYHWRYAIPAFLLVHLAVASLLAEPLARSARLAGPALRLATLALPVAAMAAWGLPSLARVRADLDRVAGRHTEDLLAARCDLMAGDYWSVWPAVWHVMLVSGERGQPWPLHGVCHRANPTVPDWWSRPRDGLRLCMPRTAAAEREAKLWLPWYGLWPLRLLERQATLDVFAVPSPSPASQAAPPGAAGPAR